MYRQGAPSALRTSVRPSASLYQWNSLLSGGVRGRRARGRGSAPRPLPRTPPTKACGASRVRVRVPPTGLLRTSCCLAPPPRPVGPGHAAGAGIPRPALLTRESQPRGGSVGMPRSPKPSRTERALNPESGARPTASRGPRSSEMPGPNVRQGPGPGPSVPGASSAEAFSGTGPHRLRGQREPCLRVRGAQQQLALIQQLAGAEPQKGHKKGKLLFFKTKPFPRLKGSQPSPFPRKYLSL